MFREQIQKMLDDKYDFYVMRAHPGVNGEEYIKHNFKKVVGKVYTPFKDKETFSLALDNKDKDNNDKLVAELEEFFIVKKCDSLKESETVAKGLPADNIVTTKDVAAEDLALCVTKEGINYENAVAKLRQTGKLGIALNMNGATLQLVEGFTKAKYLIIHNKSDKYAAFFVDGKGPKLISANEMTDMVTTKMGAALYLVYNAELHVNPAFGELDFSPITKSGDSYSPHLLPIASLIKQS